MGFLLDFFFGSAARVKGLLIGTAACAVLCLALLVMALWWRGAAYQARGERDVAIAQARVLAQGIEACTAGVNAVERTSAAAIDTGKQLLAEAKRLHAGAAVQVEKLEQLLGKKPPVTKEGKPAGCDDAWQEIEKG